ncbi:MAG: hypothetical protein WBC94_17485, partial [Xanthobacteraceae bacterium]
RLVLRITEQKIEKSRLRRCGREANDGRQAGKHGRVPDRLFASTPTRHGDASLQPRARIINGVVSGWVPRFVRGQAWRKRFTIMWPDPGAAPGSACMAKKF